MSYARMGCDGSDVFVYGSDDLLICQWCSLADKKNRYFKTFSEMIRHLQNHREIRDKVPDETIKELESDQKKYGDIYDNAER